MQILMDDDIDMIAMKVGASIEDALEDFQEKKQNYVSEMAKDMATLQTSIAKLRMDHSPSASLQEQ